jgi:hypothetical protein
LTPDDNILTTLRFHPRHLPAKVSHRICVGIQLLDQFLNLRRAPFLLLALLLPLSIAVAAQDDSHLKIDPAAPIYQRSVFLHGYAHGYELGFHSGDVDLHMARSSRDPRTIKMFKDSKRVYQRSFGNRDMFINGYEQGFRVGYADAFYGRDFRAARELRTLSQQMQDMGGQQQNAGLRQVSNSSEFDKGIADGYKAGLSNGLEDARSSKGYHPENSECSRKSNDGQFCPAHRLGYELGYSDGYNNQRNPEEGVKTAKERGETH